jgi:kynureninase
VAERLTAAVNDGTAAVMVSSVFFLNAHIVPGLSGVLRACQRVGAELLIDAYHALNVVPVSLRREGLGDAFVVGGGYKYCQLGEGNCFLRVPEDCGLRPVITGWFSEFDALATPPGELAYGRGAARFAGATYDPTSHYRGARVFDFFERQALNPDLLRRVSQHQIGVLSAGFDALDADPGVIDRDRATPPHRIAGFLALTTPLAERLSRDLRARGVATDYRGDVLRFGPAPYLADSQLEAAMEALGECLRGVTGV